MRLDYRPIERGQMYRWRDTDLIVLARCEEELCVDADDEMYREYVFKGRILSSDNPKDVIGSIDRFVASGGWEEM